MKKIIITSIFAAIITTLPCAAQWRAGLSAGAALNHYTMDMNYMYDFRIGDRWGASASAMAQRDIFDWLGIRGEINFIQKDYRTYRTGFYSQFDYVNHNTYLQVPLLASMSFGGETIRGFINLGVYGAYWLKSGRMGTMPSHESFSYYTDTSYSVETAGFNPHRDQRWDFGPAGGAGIDWLICEHLGFQAEARLYYGLVNTVDTGRIYKEYRYHTTMTLQGTLYYKF